MNPNSDTIKAAVASHFRYTRQCTLIAFECCARLKTWSGEIADIVVITEGGLLTVVEVKISISDFRGDKKKGYHRTLSNAPGVIPVTHFYFAVPKELANKVAYLCDDLYPYAGVIGSNGLDQFDIAVHRKPRNLKGGKVTAEQIKYIERSQSATLCRLATKVSEQKQVRRNLEAQIKEYKDMERLTGDKPDRS